MWKPGGRMNFACSSLGDPATTGGFGEKSAPANGSGAGAGVVVFGVRPARRDAESSTAGATGPSSGTMENTRAGSGWGAD